MSLKKTNYIAKLENAIRDRWGEIAADNPQKYWTEEISEKYKKEMKELQKKIHKHNTNDEKTEKDGYIVSREVKSRGKRENCEACGKLSFSSRDDIYLLRFNSCYECYFEYIEGREKRWENGWRPNNEE